MKNLLTKGKTIFTGLVFTLLVGTGTSIAAPVGITGYDILNADVSGTIKATINVNELLSLKASCNLDGEISTNKLHIEPGANFTGSCQMGGVVKGIEENEQAQKVS